MNIDDNVWNALVYIVFLFRPLITKIYWYTVGPSSTISTLWTIKGFSPIKNLWISRKYLLNALLWDILYDTLLLVHVMAWHTTGSRPLSNQYKSRYPTPRHAKIEMNDISVTIFLLVPRFSTSTCIRGHVAILSRDKLFTQRPELFYQPWIVSFCYIYTYTTWKTTYLHMQYPNIP